MSLCASQCLSLNYQKLPDECNVISLIEEKCWVVGKTILLLEAFTRVISRKAVIIFEALSVVEQSCFSVSTSNFKILHNVAECVLPAHHHQT